MKIEISKKQWDEEVKGNLFNVFHKHYRETKRADALVGDMEKMIAGLSDDDILKIIKASPTYLYIAASQRDDQNLIRVTRASRWKGPG